MREDLLFCWLNWIWGLKRCSKLIKVETEHWKTTSPIVVSVCILNFRTLKPAQGLRYVLHRYGALVTKILPLSKHRSDATLRIYTKGYIFQPPEFSFSMDLLIFSTSWNISHKCWLNFWNAVISPLLYITKHQPHNRGASLPATGTWSYFHNLPDIWTQNSLRTLENLTWWSETLSDGQIIGYMDRENGEKCGSSLYGQRIWRKLGFQSTASKKSVRDFTEFSSSNKQQEAEPVAPDFNVSPQYKCTSPSYSVQDRNW